MHGHRNKELQFNMINNYPSKSNKISFLRFCFLSQSILRNYILGGYDFLKIVVVAEEIVCMKTWVQSQNPCQNPGLVAHTCNGSDRDRDRSIKLDRLARASKEWKTLFKSTHEPAHTDTHVKESW